MNRGYSWLNIRSVDEEKRIIRGIATTPTVARDGDIIETKGIQFKLPLPFLWRHKDPFGNVTKAAVNHEGIEVEVQVGRAGISASIDEQWAMVREGIVRGLSLGWRTLEEHFDKTFGGFVITKSEWLELSAVPVPADPNALISSVRSADEEILAAMGRENRPARERHNHRPGASGQPPKRGNQMPKGMKERLADLEAKRVEIATGMTAIMEKAEAEGREMTETEGPEYDGLNAQLRETDKSIERLRGALAAANGAKPVQAEEEPLQVRRPLVQKVEQVEHPKGTGMARAVISLINARGNHHVAAQLAREHYKDMPGVEAFLRTAVPAGDTTTSGWASQLVPAAQQLASEFLDLLRPETIIGKLSLRRVPFNVAVPIQTVGGTYAWVGEGAPKPATKLTVSSVSLRWAKCAGIMAFTQELARFSSPAAESIIRNDMVRGTAAFLDVQFLDDSVGEVSNVSPASITNSKAANTVSGTTAEDFRYDMSVCLTDLATSGHSLGRAAIIMTDTQAVNLASMVNSLGNPEFPTINASGGSYFGIPIIVSQSVPGGEIVVVIQDQILLADDGGVNISMSDQATLQMDTAPTAHDDSPYTAPVWRSLWQDNLIALRVERFITWKRARTSAVEWLDNAAYAPSPASP